MNATRDDGSAGDADYGIIGAWDAEWGALRTTPQYDGPLRLVISRLG